MKLITENIDKKTASNYFHTHENIFSFPIYHKSIIDPNKKMNRMWNRRYNDSFVFLSKIFESVFDINNKIIYDFTCNIGTNSFLALEYDPLMVYGIDNDYICLLISQYIKNNLFKNRNIYFFHGDITKENCIINKETDVCGLLINLPFSEETEMLTQVEKFLKINIVDNLITDSLYDNILEKIFLKYYTKKETYGYYSIYSL